MDFPSRRYRDNADSSTGYLFIKVYNKWHARIKNELKQTGITHPQFVVLTVLNYLLQSKDFVTQVKIAGQADMDVMTCSQILRDLEKKGYVKRFPNPEDIRANAVQLTPTGMDIVRQALPRVEKIDDMFFGALQDQEEKLRQLMLKLLKTSEDNKNSRS